MKVIDIDEFFKIKIEDEKRELIHKESLLGLRNILASLAEKGIEESDEVQYAVATIATELLVNAFHDNPEDIDKFLDYINMEVKEEIYIRNEDEKISQMWKEAKITYQ